METFPPELAQRLSNFSTSLLEFARLCHSKSQGGQFSVDSQILESLKALQEKVVEFQGEAHMYPELPNTLIHLLEKHGNPLVKQAFLK